MFEYRLPWHMCSINTYLPLIKPTEDVVYFVIHSVESFLLNPSPIPKYFNSNSCYYPFNNDHYFQYNILKIEYSGVFLMT